MCRIFEEYGDERAAEARVEALVEAQSNFIEALLRQNKLSLEEIAAVAKVPLEHVRQMAEALAVGAQA